MTLLERVKARLCTRCQRRERYADLTVCVECANQLVGRTGPEWRKHLTAKDLTERDAA